MTIAQPGSPCPTLVLLIVASDFQEPIGRGRANTDNVRLNQSLLITNEHDISFPSLPLISVLFLRYSAAQMTSRHVQRHGMELSYRRSLARRAVHLL